MLKRNRRYEAENVTNSEFGRPYDDEYATISSVGGISRGNNTLVLHTAADESLISDLSAEREVIKPPSGQTTHVHKIVMGGLV